MTFLSTRKLASLFSMVLSNFLIVGAALAADRVYPPLVNWAAPATWSPHGAGRGVSTMSDITNPVPFIATTPCRQYDSRNATKLPTSTDRVVTISGAPCGLPNAAVAVSLNITVFNITGATGNGVFLLGTTAPPTTAWINYPPTETQRGNAGVAPLNLHAIVVRVEQGGGSVDFTVDVNGYYTGGVLSADEALFLQGNLGGPTIVGVNLSAAAGLTCGVGGEIDGIGNTGAGVIGLQTSTTGLNSGVLGINLSTTEGAAGVFGLANATRGNVIGVLGVSASDFPDAAGVKGVDLSGEPAFIGYVHAGVRGDSRTGVGVFGVSQYIGVWGEVFSTAGSPLAMGVLGSSTGVAPDMMQPPWAVFAFGNLGANGTKHFVEPHPSDPRKVILYSSLEGREVGTYFRGTARVVNREAVIEIPEDFRIVTDDEGLTVQLTPIGAASSMYVESKDLNRIVVKSSRDVTFDYLVQGVRRAFKDLAPVRNGYEFMPRSPDEKMPAYLTEEDKRRLVANGTYNPDGTVNMSTAERAGWAKIWADRRAEEEAARTAIRQGIQPSGFQRP